MTPEEKSKLEHDILIQELFGEGKSNKTPAAKLRDLEQSELAEQSPIIDLRLIPQEERASYNQSWVTLPPNVANELKSSTFPLGEKQVNSIEAQAMEYHNVKDPCAILIDPSFAKNGKNWHFEPSIETIRSGLIYFHNP